ncbi:MAG: hypothetical protein NVSMB39_6730 [Candidatus Saccharimonadales bacterium]
MEKIDLDAYFAKKRLELGMDRQNTLEQVQVKLDEWYPGQARARKLHQGVLRLETASASVASELRMRQLELFEAVKLPDTRLAISITQAGA